MTPGPSDWRDDDDLALLRARRHAATLRHPTARDASRPADPAPSVVGARTVGPLAMVDIGWTVWARTDGNVRHMRMDARGEARGGVIVEITTRRNADPDTGEISADRAFRCADPYATPSLRVTTLTEAQVDPDSVELPERMRRWRVICALLEAARRPGRPLDLARTEHDRVGHILDAWRLARAGGPR
jgi:hypothetical protein